MVNSSSAQLLRDPIGAIHALFEEATKGHAPAAHEDYGITTLFEESFEEPSELAKVPSLTALWQQARSNNKSSLHGKLARVQCHVVHSDSEIYGGAYRNRQGGGWQFGRYGCDIDEALTGPLREDAISFEERTTLDCRCHADPFDLTDALQNVSLASGADDDVLKRLTVKLYNEKEEGLLHATLDIVGLVEVADEEVILHALIARDERLASRLSSSTEQASAPETRDAVMQELAAHLSGDALAAECLLLALCASVTVRSPVLIGPIALNLRNIEGDQASALKLLIQELAAYTEVIDLSIAGLNKHQLFPTHDGEQFKPGQIQLPKDTVVLLDESALSEGKLEERGVKNLQCLANSITSQELVFAFPFNEFKIAMDLCFIDLSKGKSLLPSTLSIPVKSGSTAAARQPASMTLKDMAIYIARCRLQEVEISDEVSQAIQNDFVRARKAGEAIDQALFGQGLALAKEVTRSYKRRQMVFDDYRRGVALASEVNARQ
ncbi:putative alanine racemase-domain-containing protein [Protomyces lactucae-debilis]|uniref:Putative alanine racemase-domain-containing protein n=1 Tax=Protomyces lactucae-debilis TaxID=2754530 RepID=A0A1Y2FSU0_PROLT|nr:putative alanine racemase-domain-containing protein [Protomyces lactucae-debilis]ORY86256.1 putative alanine racemase-domain-containing protein [Protomyces lactucae-debilis]